MTHQGAVKHWGIALLLVATTLPGVSQAGPDEAEQKHCRYLLTNRENNARGTYLGQLLQSKNYASLQKELHDRQLKIEQGAESDEPLRTDFLAGFFGGKASAEPFLHEWIAKYPKSYEARVALATHYIGRGYAKRGTEFARATTEEQMAALHRDLDLANAELETAMSLTKAPTVAYAETFEIVRTSRGSIGDLVREGNQRFPKSLAIKVEEAFALNPKWGGSLEALDQLRREATASPMRADEIRTLKYYVAIEKANYFEVAAQVPQEAIKKGREAAAICDVFMPWEIVARAAKVINDWGTAIEATTNLIRLDSLYTEAIRDRAWAYEQAGQMVKAVQDYETAARLGDAWAQNRLGWFYWNGSNVPRDVDKARKLFEQSAVQGNETAVANLKLMGSQVPK